MRTVDVMVTHYGVGYTIAQYFKFFWLLTRSFATKKSRMVNRLQHRPRMRTVSWDDVLIDKHRLYIVKKTGTQSGRYFRRSYYCARVVPFS